MRILSAVLALMISLTTWSACSSKEEPEVQTAASELERTSEEVRRAQIQLAQSVKEPMDKDAAIQSASRHLALKQVRWGKPTAVREDEEAFYISYQTPEQELRMIGARVLIVNKTTGVVTPQKRR